MDIVLNIRYQVKKSVRLTVLDCCYLTTVGDKQRSSCYLWSEPQELPHLSQVLARKSYLCWPCSCCLTVWYCTKQLLGQVAKQLKNPASMPGIIILTVVGFKSNLGLYQCNIKSTPLCWQLHTGPE